jgi:hypothetical protein
VAAPGGRYRYRFLRRLLSLVAALPQRAGSDPEPRRLIVPMSAPHAQVIASDHIG